MGNATLPKGQDRGLTPGEIEMARTVFGNSLDYSKIRVHNGKSNRFQSDDTTVTPNGEMYCANNYCDDFSKQNQLHFMHEMTHIWQYQNNVLSPRVAAVTEEVKSGFCYSKCYAYTPDQKKDLIDYNLEQQADMVADYWAMKERKAHPEPPAAPATPEGLEKSLFGQLQLKQLTQMHAKEPKSPQVKAALATGNFAFDSHGQAHFTQKYADQLNADRKQDDAARAQRDADLEKVMAKFARDPSYARKPTLMQRVELFAAKSAIEAVQLTGPIMPFGFRK